ncbi:MAG: hypothetical protein ACUVXJ_18770 [Phycisphaerae bacterium]
MKQRLSREAVSRTGLPAAGRCISERLVLHFRLNQDRSTTSNTVSGRVAGFQIGTSGDPDADYDVTYHYDVAGRIARIVGPGLPAYGVEYSRLADSDLVEYARYKSDASTTLATLRRAYEASRDLVDYVQNDTSATVSKYDYVNDALGRRTSVVYTGSAFSQNHLFLWGYNPRSELIAADRHQGTDPGSPRTQYGTDGAFDYAYDPIALKSGDTIPIRPTRPARCAL